MSRDVETYAAQSEPGSPVRVLLPEEGTARFDPFLVVHEQGPVRYPPRRAIGFPDHPHRGIETITYVIRGEQYHRDSCGHEGVLSAGDVQWMSAAAGIIHSELPTEELYERGGEVHAFQIWLNLPKARKMDPPRYQEARAADLPQAREAATLVRVLAGEWNGTRSPIECGRPFLMLHVRCAAACTHRFSVPAGSTAIAYAIAGQAEVDGAAIRAGEIAVGRERAAVTLRADDAGADVLLLAAQPIDEPVVSRGPFVMTSEAEIERAYRDLIEGRFGHTARIG